MCVDQCGRAMWPNWRLPCGFRWQVKICWGPNHPIRFKSATSAKQPQAFTTTLPSCDLTIEGLLTYLRCNEWRIWNGVGAKPQPWSSCPQNQGAGQRARGLAPTPRSPPTTILMHRTITEEPQAEVSLGSSPRVTWPFTGPSAQRTEGASLGPHGLWHDLTTSKRST